MGGLRQWGWADLPGTGDLQDLAEALVNPMLFLLGREVQYHDQSRWWGATKIGNGYGISMYHSRANCTSMANSGIMNWCFVGYSAWGVY